MRRFFIHRAPALFFITAIFSGIFFFAVPAKASVIYVSGDIASDTTWTSNNVYVIQSQLIVDTGIKLTVSSGTVVKFYDSGSNLRIDGILMINGTAANKVYFTSINDNSVGGSIGSSTGNPMPGDWDEIFFNTGSSSTFNDAVIRYGGHYGGSGEISQNGGGVIHISNSVVASSSYNGVEASGAPMSIINTTITNNFYYGIYATGDSSVSLSSDTFSYNQGGVGFINLSNGISFSPSNDVAFSNQGGNGFSISGTLTTDEVLTSDIPYILNSGPLSVVISSGTTLNIDAGVIIKVGLAATYSYLEVNGDLNVLGTSTNQVYFTSLNDDSIGGDTNNDGTSTLPAPGDWAYLLLNSGSSSTFNNAVIRYGGARNFFGELLAYGSSVDIFNSQIASSSNGGIYLGGGTLISGNNNISNNSTYGLFNNTNVTSSASAQYNYWGDPSGPYNPNTNPNGKGNAVSDYVNYIPWLTQWNNGSSTVSASNLQQYKSDGITSISEGSTTTDSTLVFAALLGDSSSTASTTLQLQVEVTTSTFFSNIPTAISSSVAPGSAASTTLQLFPESWSNGAYHWQARAVDNQGNYSPWTTFGPSATSTDFIVNTVPHYTQVISTYPSLGSTTVWASASYNNNWPETIASSGCYLTVSTMIMRFYGITTSVSGTDVDPLTLDNWLASTTIKGFGKGFVGDLVNPLDVPYFAKTPSGTFRMRYNPTRDYHKGVSSTWVNKWLLQPTTTPVIFGESLPTINGGTGQHVTLGTGVAFYNDSSTYTLREPYKWYNTHYLDQPTDSGPHVYDYNNTYKGAAVFEQASSTHIPLYLEYEVLDPTNLLIVDPNGNRTGVDASGTSYNEIPNGIFYDDTGVQFFYIDTPIAGQYIVEVNNSSQPYMLSNSVADGVNLPTPQVLTGPSSTASMTYTQNYDPNNLASSTLY